ncbi:putative gustatory receptor 28a [Melitaea cinxia]|uniref:putative gustatory receptor 28a n=1 Tax=Melitaea cinxia TaxID=113334 RepID=UPI001E274650|nr:putative gustatory receptor 28a [Melitaea cinxia]
MMSGLAMRTYRILKPKRLLNIVDSSYLIRYLRKIAGASVLTIESNSHDEITTTFTFFGFICFVFWYCIYFYCLYKIHVDDQTILRTLYDTKLKHYGDGVERIMNTMFISYAMWKVPFDLSGSANDMQLIVDIDKAIKNLVGEIDYSRHLHLVVVICLAHFIVSGTRVFSIWVSLLNLGRSMPMEKVFQMVFTDSIAFIIVTQYCTYLVILRRRYKQLNNVLNSINSSEFFVQFIRPRTIDKTLLVQEKQVCKKIKACGKIYSMLYKATETANEKYGLVLLLTMLMTLLQLVLYLYYFMEATASGLFRDLQNYIDFLIYIAWQISFALTIIYVCIYFSEATVKEARTTAHVTHEIINSDASPTLITEAVNLSLQTLQQTPTFTAHGLFKLDHVILLEGARSVTTYLVILLQFVTDKR